MGTPSVTPVEALGNSAADPSPAQLLLSRLGRIFSALMPRRSSPAPPTPIAKSISRLYILRVDFQVSAEQKDKMHAALVPIQDKYGIDVLILEPGMKFEPFQPSLEAQEYTDSTDGMLNPRK